MWVGSATRLIHLPKNILKVMIPVLVWATQENIQTVTALRAPHNFQFYLVICSTRYQPTGINKNTFSHKTTVAYLNVLLKQFWVAKQIRPSTALKTRTASPHLWKLCFTGPMRITESPTSLHQRYIFLTNRCKLLLCHLHEASTKWGFPALQ